MKPTSHALARTRCLHWMRTSVVVIATIAAAVTATAAIAQDADAFPSGDPMSGIPGGTDVSRRPAAELPPITADTPGGSVAVLSARASFDRYEIKLDDAGQLAFDALLAQLEDFTSVLSIRVIGHADSRGNDADNLLLSRERAASIASDLREQFPDTHIIDTGFGEAQPIADNATDEGRATNRRVEIQVIALARHE